jgi:short-subunit dehydrogenase
MDIRNKRFLITGASSGIGAATARCAASKGSIVTVIARSEEKLGILCREIRDSGGAANYYVADLSDFAAVREVATAIQDSHGTPDIIMNNAGSGQWKYAQETTPEEASAMMAIPYLSAFAVTHAFLPQLIERQSGLVINVTSAAAYMVWPGATSYIAARWAMRGFSDALRAELKPHGVGVMLVALAKVTSDYWAHNPGSEKNIPDRQSMIPELSPETAAKHIVNGIENDKRQVIEPWQLRFILALLRFFPGMVK